MKLQKRTCYKCDKIFMCHNTQSVRTFCSRECYTFKYHPIIQAEFWRNVLPNSGKYHTGSLALSIPTDWIPHGIMSCRSYRNGNFRLLFTEKQIKEFKEWNQKNV